MQQRVEIQLKSASSAPKERARFQTGIVVAAFVLLFVILSPVYYANRWDFTRRKRRNPFYTSRLVHLKERHSLLYELATFVENFPAWDRVYAVLPHVSGDVLQV